MYEIEVKSNGTKSMQTIGNTLHDWRKKSSNENGEQEREREREVRFFWTHMVK